MDFLPLTFLTYMLFIFSSVYEAINTILLDRGRKVKNCAVEEAVVCLFTLRSLKSVFKIKQERLCLACREELSLKYILINFKGF